MADAVSSEVIFSGLTKYAVRFTCISDGTGENKATKVDISTLIGSPTFVGIEEYSWDVQGFSSIQIYFDHTTDDIIDIMSGRGARSYKDLGYLFDPQSAGGTGDILLSSTGATAGATYDLVLVLQLRGGGQFY